MFDPLQSKARILLYALIAVALGVGGASALGWNSLTASPTITLSPQVADAQVQPALDLSEAFVNLAKVVTPAVIRIEAERPGNGQVITQMPDQIPEQFRDFFGPFGLPQDPNAEPLPNMAGGSGFIVSPDGYILTNDHVVADATRIRVFLSDRREYIAEVVGTDPLTDVAVIKINGGDLPTLSIGSSASLQVGEWVLAIGNPGLGGPGSQLDYTVTAGIVSAMGRRLPVISDGLRRNGEEEETFRFAIEDFIQTDAVINPGNSGGPLVNVRGEVIGINSAIASQTGYYQGYGFAIPIDLAQRVMEDLIEFGEVHRAYLGVQMRPADAVDAEYYGLPRTTGVLVQEVPTDGPASAAGLQPEDVIVAVDGEDIERSAQLQSLIAQKRPGDEVRVRFYRGGRVQELDIRLGEAPLQPRVAQVPAAIPTVPALLGLEFRPLDAAAAQELGYSGPGGVVIGSVSPAGPAVRQGITGGEKVLQIGRARAGDREPVNSLEDVNRILGDLGRGEIVSLQLQRPDVNPFVVNLRVPE